MMRYGRALLRHPRFTQVLRCAGTDSKEKSLGAPTKTRDTTPNRMRAWQIHSYGGLAELQLTTARAPSISSSTELLVKVLGASLNPIDYMMMGGYAKTVLGFFRQHELEFPLTLGRDFCGSIVGKGQDVGDNLRLGDIVYGVLPIHKQGSLAEVVVADKSLVRKKPTHLSASQASTILYAALTAWSALYITGELCLRKPRGTHVLVLGASGGVGTLAVQMLKAVDATVVGTCASDAVNLVRELGAEGVHDYMEAGFKESVAAAGPYSIILDCANFGYRNVPTTWKCEKYITLSSPFVKNTDRYGLLGGMAASATDLISSNFPKCASGTTVRWGFFYPFTEGIELVDKLVKQQKVSPVIHHTFRFHEVPQAFEMLAAGHLRGKIAIDFT